MNSRCTCVTIITTLSWAACATCTGFGAANGDFTHETPADVVIGSGDCKTKLVQAIPGPSLAQKHTQAGPPIYGVSEEEIISDADLDSTDLLGLLEDPAPASLSGDSNKRRRHPGADDGTSRGTPLDVTLPPINSNLNDVAPVPMYTHIKEEAAGGSVTRALGSDLLGDSLEPTNHGQGTKSHGHHAQDGHAHAHSQGYIALLFFLGTLAIGSGVLLFLERSKLPVPYTSALFVVGCVSSILHYVKFLPESEGQSLRWQSWFASVDMWQAIDPHMLFNALLPALIFGEAMRLNVNLVARCFAQVFTLACPGMLLGAFMTGLFAQHVLPYNWEWPISMCFGSILSATDPVAVVALFNTLGVSPRLTMLISGESLLNDGTAIVIFQLMLKISLGAQVRLYDVTAFFAQMTVTSFLLGLAMGAGTLVLLGVCAEEHYHSDAMIQVVVTICCGYLAFFLSEIELSSSGVIATVTAGFVVAYSAWPRVVSKETMHTVWEAIEFVGNTIIFFLAGVIFANLCMERLGDITWRDVGWLLILYFAVTVIRAVMVAIFWIPLNFLGQPLHWQEGLMMVWSGLRGAVSLALAIMVDNEEGIDKLTGSRVLFHVGGIAALTMMVNATTAAPLLRYLGLTKTSFIKDRMIQQLTSQIATRTTEEFEAHMDKPDDVRFVGARRQLVCAMVPSLQSEPTPPPSLCGSQQQEMPEGPGMSKFSFVERELVRIYREVFLRAVQSYYWDAIQEGVIPRNLKVARILLQSTDEALDNTWQGLNDWDVISRHINMKKPGFIEALIGGLVEYRPLCWFPEFRRMYSLDFRMIVNVYAALSMLEAHERARREVPKYFGGDSALDFKVQEKVRSESVAQCLLATGLLEMLPEESVELGKSEMLARRLLTSQIEEVQSVQEKGLLTPSESGRMEHLVTSAMRKIVNQPKDQWLSFKYNPDSEQS